jgi:hypothetical protein
MALAQQLSDHAAHRVTRDDESADTKHLGQRGGVVGAVFKPEPRSTGEALAMATLVKGDHAEPDAA